jgi:hypothetical protein
VEQIGLMSGSAKRKDCSQAQSIKVIEY